MNIFKKENESVSIPNVLNVLVLIASIFGAVFPIWQPFIPTNIVPYVLGVIATLNVLIQVFSTATAPVKGAIELKAKMGIKSKG